jgi:outer membrane protein assembly factor BamB
MNPPTHRARSTVADDGSSVAEQVSIPAPGRYLCGLTWDGRWLWHSDQDAACIYAIDPSAGSIVHTYRCDEVRADMAFDGTMLCQVGGRPKRLVLVDPRSGNVAGHKAILPASGRVTGIEFGPEGLWMCLREPMVVQLRDYSSMQVRREFTVSGSSPSGLTYADGLVVYGEFESAILHSINPANGAHVGSTEVDGRPTGLTWDGNRLWYCDFPGRAIRSIARDCLTGSG